MKRQRASTLRGGSRDSPPEASALALQPVYQPAVPVPPPPAPPPPSRKAAKKPKASAAAAAAAQQHTQPIVASQQPLQGQEDISLEERIQQNQEQLRAVERQIYSLESLYLENANPCGNAIKGYDNLLSTTARKAQLRHEDRIFSGSSVTGQLP